MKKEKIPKFFYNLRCEATRPGNVQRDGLVVACWSDPAEMRLVSMPYKAGTRTLFFDRDDAERFYKKIIADMVNDYPNHLRMYSRAVKNLNSVSKMVEKSSGLSNTEKANNFAKWLIALKAYYLPIVVPFAIEDILDGQCRELLQKEFGEKYNEAYSIISSPSKLNFYQKMRVDIDGLVIKNKIKSAEIEKLVKKYSWYSEYSFVEPFLDKKYFQKELSRLTKKTALAERNHILGDIKKNKKEFSAVRKKIKNPRTRLLATILNDYTFLRTDRIENLKLSQSRIRPLYESIRKELNGKIKNKWTKYEVVNFTNQEIVDFLERGKIPDRKEIAKRVSHNYIFYFDTKPHFIYDLKTIVKVQKIIQESGKKNQEIKGLPAFKGIICGKVIIVHGKKDLSRVKEGMILVARTTMPDYTHAMKRVEAFVTEEGGITSHAAIISRELKKPCIVGTGNCTKILKDGDMVEVDADSGIVKIIKKA